MITAARYRGSIIAFRPAQGLQQAGDAWHVYCVSLYLIRVPEAGQNLLPPIYEYMTLLLIT